MFGLCLLSGFVKYLPVQLSWVATFIWIISYFRRSKKHLLSICTKVLSLQQLFFFSDIFVVFVVACAMATKFQPETCSISQCNQSVCSCHFQYTLCLKSLLFCCLFWCCGSVSNVPGVRLCLYVYVCLFQSVCVVCLGFFSHRLCTAWCSCSDLHFIIYCTKGEVNRKGICILCRGYYHWYINYGHAIYGHHKYTVPF